MLDIEQLLSSDDKRSLGHIEELIHLVKTHIVNLHEARIQVTSATLRKKLS